jgi:hypothetical protein
VLRSRQQTGHIDLEASERAIRSSVQQVGGHVLEKLMNADGGGYQGNQIDCGRGHQAKFVAYRSKDLVTVLSAVKVNRASYHCAACGQGRIPKDEDLDIVESSFSPGVRRMMGRVGGKEPFAEGRQDLEELAGVVVKTKAVERVSEAIGQQIEWANHKERQAALSGKLDSIEARRHALHCH